MEHHVDAAADGAGTTEFPVASDGTIGIDVVSMLPELHSWLSGAAGDDGDLVLGMYGYADRGMHVRLTAAVDALSQRLRADAPRTALAHLGTPTDAYAVPDDVVAAARMAYRSRPRRARLLAMASAERLCAAPYHRQPQPDSLNIADVLIEQQGPNYALAKRLQRWRALATVAGGGVSSFNVAPATWTRSVVKNRTLAAAYAGAHRFGVEIFTADTARTLCAALLVHDLHRQPHRNAYPEMHFADQAAHSGLWRASYDPRSALGLAALVGLPSTVRTRTPR